MDDFQVLVDKSGRRSELRYHPPIELFLHFDIIPARFRLLPRDMHEAMFPAVGLPIEGKSYHLPYGRRLSPENFVHAIFGREQVHRSEEHTSELQSPCNLVCRLLLEKKKSELTHIHISGSFSASDKYPLLLLYSGWCTSGGSPLPPRSDVR